MSRIGAAPSKIQEGASLMPDNLKDRQPQDASKINVHEAWELEYWCKALGVTPQQLKDAVQAVGVSVIAVKKYLGK
jgi:Protein of unknown function (DUF3606)